MCTTKKGPVYLCPFVLGSPASRIQDRPLPFKVSCLCGTTLTNITAVILLEAVGCLKPKTLKTKDQNTKPSFGAHYTINRIWSPQTSISND